MEGTGPQELPFVIAPGTHVRLGEMLLSRQLITAEDLERAHELQKERGEKLGKILVDGKGMTLYMYTKDTPNTSVCYDKCAVAWPPLLTIGQPTLGDNVSAGAISTTLRKDGSVQVTYNNWPLYYFFKDKAPGDVKGQGVTNNWWVVSGEGNPIKPASLAITTTGKLGKILGWGIPAFIVGLILFGFFYSGMTATAQMVKWWTLTTAVLAAAGAAVVFGHPLTILSAAAAAPFTTLHPLIAAGWVSGLVEAAIAKPKVKDFERLLDDIASVKGFWRNKITRILLVVVFTNIGASLGTFVAIPLMVKVLA